MVPAKFQEIGAALYGPRWQSELARALGVNDRTVRRWVSGDSAIPETVWYDLRKLIAAHENKLRKAMQDLLPLLKAGD